MALYCAFCARRIEKELTESLHKLNPEEAAVMALLQQQLKNDRRKAMEAHEKSARVAPSEPLLHARFRSGMGKEKAFPVWEHSANRIEYLAVEESHKGW